MRLTNTNELSDDVRKYIRAGAAVVGVVMAVALTSGHSIDVYRLERAKLENSGYVAKIEGNMAQAYGYDDNHDGKIDRVEELNTVPFLGISGLPVWVKRTTARPGDEAYLLDRN